MFMRRNPRVCKFCGKPLKRKPKEKHEKFMSRETCDLLCTRKLKEKEGATKCFCGAYKMDGGDHCCWEHRIIEMRCKQWGIEVSITSYEFHSGMLLTLQKEEEAKKVKAPEYLVSLYYKNTWFGKRG